LIKGFKAVSAFISGCNSFEAFNQSLNGTDQETLISRGNIALDEGRYQDALELFERAAESGNINDEIHRGKACSLAGKAGFNMFQTLKVMQNGVIPGDSPATIFLAASGIKDNAAIKEAVVQMRALSVPTLQDRLVRALLTAINHAVILVEKYDTNLNGRLDKNDQIDFDTRDDKTALWSTIYGDIISISGTYSMEQAFNDLRMALDGRGEDWVLISPIQGTSYAGKFTQANRQSILALANFTDAIEAAEVYFNNSESLFKQTLVALDGNE
jgi:tetratricopeptide (TPR) repeat protein